LLSELAALLRLEGGNAEGAALVARMLSQLQGTNANDKAPRPTTPRSAQATGYDRINAGADRIREQTLKLPVPQKGQQLLTEQSSVVQDSRQIAEALKRLGEAAKAGEGEALIAAARDVQSFCKRLAVELKKMIAATNASTDRDTLDRLHGIYASLINHPTQIKIMASVKASMEKRDYDKGDQLVSLVANLSANVLAVIPSVNNWILTR
jgi:hypothetical protein